MHIFTSHLRTKNKVDFFKREAHSSISIQKTLKEDFCLVSQLVISCQRREYDFIEFFQHENYKFPASLSDNGQLHVTRKSQVADMLESKVKMPDLELAADAIVLSGSALVNASAPLAKKPFSHENF